MTFIYNATIILSVVSKFIMDKYTKRKGVITKVGVMKGANEMNLPYEIVKNYIDAAKKKAEMPLVKLILLGIFAGMFIACGAEASSVAMHSISNVGLARFIGGCIFPVGLMMIVFIGGELFTGDCLMIMGCVNKKVKVFQMIKVLVVVYLANFIGALTIAFFTYISGQYNYSDSVLAAYTIKVAMGKESLSFGTAFFSGILCNIFVCVAVLMAMSAKDIAGKALAIFFPIMAFVVSGFEHCVANMYYIPAGILAKMNSEYAEVAMETYGYSQAQIDSLNWSNFITKSAIPVTLGNIVGGMVFVGLIIYFINVKDIQKNNEK